MKLRTSLMAAALGLLALAVSTPPRQDWVDCPRRSLRGQLLGLVGTLEEIGARFPGAPPSALSASSVRSSALRALAGEIEAAARHARSTRTLSDLALLHFVLGNADESVSKLEALHRSTPGDRLTTLDLASAYLARGRKAQSPRDVVRALDLLGSETQEAVGVFNRALALEELYAHRLALRAWDRYLELDPSSGWAELARDRRSHLARQLHERQNPTPGEPRATLRRWIVEKGLPGWAESVRTEDRERRRALEHRLAETARIEGDRLAAEEAAILEGATGAQRVTLAEGLTFWEEGRRALEAYAFERARAALEQSLPLLRRAADPRAGWAEVGIAECDFQTKRYEEARRRAEEILVVAEASGYLALEARAAWVLAKLDLARLDLDRALHWARRARSAGQEAGDRTTVATANLLLGRVLNELGLPDDAWFHRIEGMHDLEILGDDRRLAVTIGNASFALAREGLHHAAADFASEALAFDRLQETPLGMTESLWIRAQHRASAGNDRGALDDVREAESHLERIQSPSIQSRLLAGLRAVEGSVLRTTLPETAVDRLAEALTYLRDGGYEYGQAEILLERARALRSLGRIEEAVADLDEATRVVIAQRGRIGQPLLRLSFFDLQTELQDERVAAVVALGDEERAFRAADEATGLLFRESLDLEPSAIASRPKAALALAEDEALVLYWTLPEELLIWTVRDSGTTLTRRPVRRKDLAEEADRLTRNLRRRAPTAAAAAAASLYARLLEPVDEQLEGVRRLVVVPDRITRGVAWPALRRGQEEPPLVDRFVLRISPSASTSLSSQTRAESRPISLESRLVALGDPAPPEGEDRLAELPAARREVRAISAMFRRPHLFLGAEATRTRLTEVLPQAEVLHIASHFTSGHETWSTRIELAPEPEAAGRGLLARDVARLRLPRLRLAVLSGCDTAREGEASLEGTFSIAGAFLAAGAEEVIASLWPVDDESAAQFMSELYPRLLAGHPPDEALREAQVALASATEHSTTATNDWAAFQILSLNLPRAEPQTDAPKRREP